MSQPLKGRRILVTRARHQAGKLSEGLRSLGAEAVEVPVLEIQPPESYEPLDAALSNLASYDWLILTSANTVRALAERAKGLRVALDGPQIAVVGAATATEAEKAGLRIDLAPEEYVAESLAAALVPRIEGRQVLLARAAVARDVIPDKLRAAGAVVDVVVAYRNGVPADAPELLRRALAWPIDAAIFTSSSTAAHLAEAAAKAGIAFPLASVPAISIGPVTSQTLRELNWPPAAEADPHDIPGLIAATEAFLREPF
jgi:uroporphyrinogen-III synthase/uroporphyrinogen III methyltransferase/synthase